MKVLASCTVVGIMLDAFLQSPKEVMPHEI